MFIRSLTLATLLAVAGPVLAADNDGPLTQDLGKSRPLIVIAPSSVDPTLVSLKKSLEEPANRQAFNERNMVLYTVLNTIGQRDGKDIDPQSTMALIRSLKLGAGAQTKVILVGKDGEKKLEHSGAIELKDVFSAIDQLPAAEKQAAAPAPAPEPQAKNAKAGKQAKPAAAPQALDD
ncbi:DUF4174 domain-containing protein [Pseudomonas sp. MSSRFD41]|uniref:DUF4174 domain-containing protein n=1 Tax=Pseudomonas sp. MSSRFD41 TaxID=1310370 RepID=UPI00163968AA|nr:DUF4174 domain-containing protein [Pseudomonas sp. MSSRFD41]MBC2657881.1 DUF4174 domain-containing protein [Pseudomonas sp. MSSRFD41]